MEIDTLSNRPELLPTIEQWLYDEFSKSACVDLGGIEELRDQGRINGLPLTLVAFDDSEPVGTASIIDETHGSQQEHCLAWVFITPSHRRKGYGSVLCRQALEVARSLNTGRVVLYAAPNIAGFYDRLGWSRSEVFYIANGEKFQLMFNVGAQQP